MSVSCKRLEIWRNQKSNDVGLVVFQFSDQGDWQLSHGIVPLEVMVFHDPVIEFQSSTCLHSISEYVLFKGGSTEQVRRRGRRTCMVSEGSSSFRKNRNKSSLAWDSGCLGSSGHRGSRVLDKARLVL